MPEVIDEGSTGFIVENEEQAGRAVGRLKELDRRSIRARFEERFLARRIAKECESQYPQLLAQSSEHKAHSRQDAQAVKLVSYAPPLWRAFRTNRHCRAVRSWGSLEHPAKCSMIMFDLNGARPLGAPETYVYVARYCREPGYLSMESDLVRRDQFVISPQGIIHKPTDAAFTPDPGDPYSGTSRLWHLICIAIVQNFCVDDVQRMMRELWAEYVTANPELFNLVR